MMDLADAILAEAATLEPDGIQTVGMGVAGGDGLGKGEHIFGHRGASPDNSVGANANELVDRTEGAHHSPLPDGHVATERRGVSQNHVIANHAIVSDMS